MADVVFIQRSRFGRSVFTLRGSDLDIHSNTFGRKAAAVIPLRSLSADYTVSAVRVPALIWWPLVLAAGCFGLFHLIIDYDIVPVLIGTYPIMFALVFVWAALKGIARVEYFTFTDQWKKPLFSILRERGQEQDCDAFVTELLERLERLDNGLAAEPAASVAAPVSSVRLSSDDDTQRETRRENRWIWAMAAGVVSTAFPIAVFHEPDLNVFSLPVVVVASTGGLIAGVLSFTEKERRKYWAIVGIALCIVPVLFL